MWTLEATVVVSIALWSKEWNPLHRVCTEGWVWKPWDWAQLIDCLVLFVTSIYHRTKWSVCFLHFHKQWEDSALLGILLHTQVHRLEYLVQVGHIINSHIFYFFLFSVFQYLVFIRLLFLQFVFFSQFVSRSWGFKKKAAHQKDSYVTVNRASPIYVQTLT